MGKFSFLRRLNCFGSSKDVVEEKDVKDIDDSSSTSSIYANEKIPVEPEIPAKPVKVEPPPAVSASHYGLGVSRPKKSSDPDDSNIYYNECEGMDYRYGWVNWIVEKGSKVDSRGSEEVQLKNKKKIAKFGDYSSRENKLKAYIYAYSGDIAPDRHDDSSVKCIAKIPYDLSQLPDSARKTHASKDKGGKSRSCLDSKFKVTASSVPGKPGMLEFRLRAGDHLCGSVQVDATKSIDTTFEQVKKKTKSLATAI